jgi:creatinine amidohydrolase
MEPKASISKPAIPYMYASLNWKDLSALKQKEKFVLLLPIGSTESHGPHCPIATDAIIALESCLRGAEELHQRGYDAYVLPPLVYTVAECARNFPGTISISEKTQSALIIEICSQLIKHGMTKICIVNNHGEPGNVRAIYDAMEEIYLRTGVKLLFPNRLRKKFGSRMPESYRKGSTHADQYETSLIMAIEASLVHEDRRKKLKDLPINLVTKIFKENINEFKEMGMDQCYCGDPASASSEEGQQTLEILAGIIVDSVEEMFQGNIPDIDRGLFGQKIPQNKD